MKKTLTFVLTLVAVCIMTGFTCAAQLKLSMLPRYSADEINKRIIPLAQHLAQEIGQPVEPVITADFGQYEKKIKSGEIQIGYENPYIYTLVSTTHEVLAMAIKGADGDKFRGIIITRADSDIRSIEDLKNRRIMVVGRTSAGGYISQKITLTEAGIDLEKDCQISEAVGNKQENVVLAVYYGEVAAGFIRESALDQVSKFIPVDQIRIVNKSAWLPNWAFSVDKSLPVSVKKNIRDALLNLDEKSSVLKALQVKGFRISSDEEYDPIRKAADMPIPKR
jgi:phosphonate transport system substrate-binding protein